MTHAEQVEHEKAWKLNDDRIKHEAAVSEYRRYIANMQWWYFLMFR